MSAPGHDVHPVPDADPDADPDAPPQLGTLLLVCTGNVCRSPLTERLLDARMVAAGLTGLALASAGTGALVGEPMTAQTEGLVRTLGGTPRAHAALQVTPEILRASDVVLTATREQRSQVTTMLPSVLRRTLTLREAERLLAHGPLVTEGDTAARLRALPGELMRRRTGPPADPGQDDVADPYGRDDRVYARAGEQISAAVTALVTALAAGEGRRAR